MTRYSIIQPIRQSSPERIAMIFIIVIYAVGVAGLAFSPTRDMFTGLIPVVLLLSAGILLAFHKTCNPVKESLILTFIVIISWAIEAAGVSTGVIFGEYSYGQALGVKLADTPILIGVNWLLLIYTTASITQQLKFSGILKIIIASLLMVLFDVVLEPVAPRLGMWEFTGGTAPLRNYLSWLIVAILLHTILDLSRTRIINRMAPAIFIVQFLFFLSLDVIFELQS